MKRSSVRSAPKQFDGYLPYLGALRLEREFLTDEAIVVARLSLRKPANRHSQLIVAMEYGMAGEVLTHVPTTIGEVAVVGASVLVQAPGPYRAPQPTCEATAVHIRYDSSPNELVVEEQQDDTWLMLPEMLAEARAWP